MRPLKGSLAIGALLFGLGAFAWWVTPTLLTVGLSSVALSAPHLLPMESGVGSDPLTMDEANRSLAIALGVDSTSDGVSTERAQNAELQAAFIHNNPTMEILLVERYAAPKGSDTESVRQGEVYLYDYASDTLVHSVVDIATGKVTTKQMQDVQLPLTPNEETRAVELLQADTRLWQKLAERYAVITGEPLHDITEIETRVSLFLGESMPDQVNEAARQCGRRRCAQVLLYTADRTVLEVLPIVDLSNGRVIQLLSDSWTTS